MIQINDIKVGLQKQINSSSFKVAKQFGVQHLGIFKSSIRKCVNNNNLEQIVQNITKISIPPLCYSFGLLIRIIQKLVHHLLFLSRTQNTSKLKELILGYVQSIQLISQKNIYYQQRLSAIKRKLQFNSSMGKQRIEKLVIIQCNKQLRLNMAQAELQYGELYSHYQSYKHENAKAYKQTLDNFLQQPTFNNVLKTETFSDNNHGPQCLGCMQSYENESAAQFNQQYSVIDAKQDTMKIQQSIADKACALLNNGGGYLILSHVENIGEGMKLCGNMYDSEEHINQWKWWIEDIIVKRIFPKRQPQSNDYQIKTRSIPIQNSKCQIIISSLIPRRYQLFFVEKKVENFLVAYTPKFLKKWHKKTIQDLCVLKRPVEYYQLMLDLYQEQNNEQQYRIKVKYKQIDQLRKKLGCIGSKQNINRLLENYRFVQDIDQEPKIVYAQQLLLIMNQKDNKGIDAVRRAFNKKNINLEVSLPYKSYRNTSHKKIWFLSSSANFKISHETIDQAINKKYLACIKCTNYLSVKNVQIQHMQKFIRDFQIKFQRNLEYIWNKSQSEYKIADKLIDTYDFYFCFKNEKQSVFSFIYLQNERTRADFAKKGQVQAAIAKTKEKIN